MGTDSFGVMSRLAAPALKTSDGSCAWLKEENVKQEAMSHQLRAEKFTRTTLHAGRRNVNFYSPVSNGRARLSPGRRRRNQSGARAFLSAATANGREALETSDPR